MCEIVWNRHYNERAENYFNGEYLENKIKDLEK